MDQYCLFRIVYRGLGSLFRDVVDPVGKEIEGAG